MRNKVEQLLSTIINANKLIDDLDSNENEELHKIMDDLGVINTNLSKDLPKYSDNNIIEIIKVTLDDIQKTFKRYDLVQQGEKVTPIKLILLEKYEEGKEKNILLENNNYNETNLLITDPEHSKINMDTDQKKSLNLFEVDIFAQDKPEVKPEEVSKGDLFDLFTQPKQDKSNKVSDLLHPYESSDNLLQANITNNNLLNDLSNIDLSKNNNNNKNEKIDNLYNIINNQQNQINVSNT